VSNQTTELRECPFCGGPAEIKRAGTHRQSMVFGCTECHAELEFGDVVGLTAPERYAWNTRATDARIEELERELKVALESWVKEHNKANDELTTLRAECEGFAEMLRLIMKSASPHPMQNPAMYSAWIKADDMLNRRAAIAKGKESGE